MTLLETLALVAFLTAVLSRVGLWYKKVWGWIAGTISAVVFLVWSAVVGLTQPGVGGWILFANDIVFIIMGIIGWWIWRRDERADNLVDRGNPAGGTREP